MVLTEDGRLYSMGRGGRGILGHGKDLLILSTPRVIDSLLSSPIARVCCMGEHVAAVTTHGEVLTWGANAYGKPNESLS